MSESQLLTKFTPRKFYFIEYFYIFLKSISETNSTTKAFEQFRSLKEELALGESKFKTKAKATGELTKRQLDDGTTLFVAAVLMVNRGLGRLAGFVHETSQTYSSSRIPSNTAAVFQPLSIRPR